MSKRLPILPLAFPIIGGALELYEWYTKPGRTYKLGANWSWCQGPANAPPPPDGPGWLSEPAFIPGSCFLGVPLYGQGGWVIPPAPIWETDPNTFQTNNEVYLTRVYGDTGGTTAHFIVDGVAQKTSFVVPDPGITYQGESAPLQPGGEPVRHWVPDPIGISPDAWVDPAPTPWRLIPDRVTNPNRPPSERREVGPDPSGSVRPIPRPNANPGLDSPGSITFEPNQPPKIVKRPPPIKRPDKGEKERKPGRKIGGKILAVLGAATELQDTIDAMYYALPKSVRDGARNRRRLNGNWKTITTIERDKLVYRHFDRVDFKKFYQNYQAMQQSDAVFGQINKSRGAYQKLGVTPHVNSDFLGQLRGLGSLAERRAFWDKVYADRRARKVERARQRGIMASERAAASGHDWSRKKYG